MEQVKVKLLHSVVLTSNEIGYSDSIVSLDKSLANLLVASKRAEFVKEDLPIGSKVELGKSLIEEDLSELNKESDLKSKGRKRK